MLAENKAATQKNKKSISMKLTGITSGSLSNSSGVICSNSEAVWPVHHAKIFPVSSAKTILTENVLMISESELQRQKLHSRLVGVFLTKWPQHAWESLTSIWQCSIWSSQTLQICARSRKKWKSRVKRSFPIAKRFTECKLAWDAASHPVTNSILPSKMGMSSLYA